LSEGSGFQFTDDAVPRAYDEVLVPRLFEPWARLLLDQCDLHRSAVVLDVATGPGTVARLAAKRIGPGGCVVATDVSRPMLEVASSKRSSPDAAPITYIESPAAPLAVESAMFEVAVCQQGLQFFPDRLAALAEMRRALRPGGHGWRLPCGVMSRTTPSTPPFTRRCATALPPIWPTDSWRHSVGLTPKSSRIRSLPRDFARSVFEGRRCR
jgi:ubiquinone/menaquinone biosynthesis C-methylase UbiE